MCGTSGKAGVLNGQKVEGGNPFEGSRSREFALPPNPNYLGAEMFYKAASARWAITRIRFRRRTLPAPYVNPYGMPDGSV